MSSNNALVQKVIDYIGFSDAAMTKAGVENERIEAHQKEALAAALQDPVRAMELVIKLAAHKNAAEMARLGTPVSSVKTAGYDPSNSLTSGYVGARDGRLKASDGKLFTGLGLNPPTN